MINKIAFLAVIVKKGRGKRLKMRSRVFVQLNQFWFFHAGVVYEWSFLFADNAFRDECSFFVLFFYGCGKLVFSAVTGFVPALHFSGSLAHASGLACLELLQFVFGMPFAFGAVR
jgi:hypothetical protein